MNQKAKGTGIDQQESDSGQEKSEKTLNPGSVIRRARNETLNDRRPRYTPVTGVRRN